MIGYQTYLTEVLTSPYVWHSDPANDQQFSEYSFTADNGVLYTVVIDCVGNQSKMYEILLSARVPGADFFTALGTTGTGDAYRILATARQIIFYHFDQFQLKATDQIEFEARDYSIGRIKLYTRLTKELATRYKMSIRAIGSKFRLQKI